jgi:ParG
VAQGKESIRVYLSSETKDSFKTTCFLKGLNMSDIAAELIENWLTENAVELATSQKKSRSPKKEEGAA